MKISLIAAIALLLVASCTAAASIGAPYQALARSAYCTGTANITIVVPVAGTATAIAPSTPVAYSADLANERFAFDLGAGGKQFTFNNGTYEYIPLPPPLSGFACFYFPEHTFAYERVAKSTAVKRADVSPLTDNYFGLVKDAGAGFSDVAIQITEGTVKGFPRLIEYSQKLPKSVLQGDCTNPTLTAARIVLPDCTGNAAPANFFQLPSACLVANVPLWTQAFCF